MIFAFEMLEHDGHYKKMTGLVDSNCTYQIIIQYADQMALSNRNDLLKNLMYRSDNIREINQVEAIVQEQTLKKLFDILLIRYSREELTLALKAYATRPAYYFPNQFVKFLQENL